MPGNLPKYRRWIPFILSGILSTLAMTSISTLELWFLAIITPGLLFCLAILWAFSDYVRRMGKEAYLLILVGTPLYILVYFLTFYLGAISATFAGFIGPALGAWVMGWLVQLWVLPMRVEPPAGLMAIGAVSWFVGCIPMYGHWFSLQPFDALSFTILTWQLGIGGSLIEWEQKYRLHNPPLAEAPPIHP